MTVKALKKKLLVILILFTMFFTNCGYTLQAIATTDEFKEISKGIFGKDEIKFNAYFVDEDGKETSEIIKNVNEHPKLVLEIIPQVEGVLKSGTLRLVPSSEERKLNFKITGTIEDKLEKFRNAIDIESLNDSSSSYVLEPVSEEVVENTVEEPTESLDEHFKSAIDLNQLKAENKVVTEEVTEEKEESTEMVTQEKDETTAEISEPIEEKTTEINEEEPEVTPVEINEEEPVVTPVETNKEEPEVTPAEMDSDEIIVDETAVIEKRIEEEKLREELENAISDISIVSDNEINLSYLKDETKVEVELEFIQDEKLSVEDLMQQFKLQLSGSFINSDLKEVEIAKEEELTIGWSYTKDFGFTSDYTKFSPFEIGETTGTILENRLVISRSEEQKYLPLKSLKLEVQVPDLNGQMPIDVEVNATKLMATKGEDIGLVTFSKDNWNYDEKSGKVVITVNNETDGYAEYSMGEDEYIIVYRYENYVEEKPNLLKKASVRLEEYSSPKNNVLEKTIDNSQEIKAEFGHIVTFAATTTDDKISKARVFANYNSEEPMYETEFKTQMSINILTSDVLKSLEIDASKEVYKDIDGTIFDTKDVKIRQVKFNYSEISSVLENGGDITIRNGNGEVLYILTYQTVNSEEDVIVNTNNCEGLIITASDIANNGVINFEITKVIQKSTYSKYAFKNFVELESRISAEVEYLGVEEKISLEEERVSKKFEEAQTIADISLNKTYLSTLNSNDDVELKIELNNDKENSDLYINPSFEVVFPKYITDVEIESVNLLYEEGLSILDYEATKEDEQVKVRVDLIGTQTRFVDSGFTNGTNIILNLNIDVDDYTPAKEDQIKMYYCNEAVTNYQTQTKWSISKSIPNEILKTTNGFDVAIINYQAPSGLVVASGIINYDGNLSEVASVKQGPKERQIPRESASRIVTMELLALNNTGNSCSDVILIGRIPFKGSKDVVTNEDLGTTTLAKMIDSIKEDINNKYMANIYYSTNPEATRSIKNEANGWKESIEDLSEVRSFLIEVKGTMVAGTALRYTYDFEIPENLPYEAVIAGSFGAYYNNETEDGIVDEASTAEKVSLITEAGPRLEAHMSVDVGDGTPVKGFDRLKYTITVFNSGSVLAEDLTIKSEIPINTNLTEVSEFTTEGDAGYIQNPAESEVMFKIDELKPGETKDFYYYVTAKNKNKIDSYADGKDENGYFKNSYKDNGEVEKHYITDTPIEYITNSAKVTSSLLANEITTNTVKNELNNSDLEIRITTNGGRLALYNRLETIELYLGNRTDRDLKNVKAILYVGDIFELDSVQIDDDNIKTSKNERNKTITVDVDNLDRSDYKKIKVNVKGKLIRGEERIDNIFFTVLADGIEPCYTSKIEKNLITSILEAKDVTYKLPEIINENEEILISTKITNIGSNSANEAYLECNIPSSMNLENVIYNGENNLVNLKDGDQIYVHIPNMAAGTSAVIDITFKAKNQPGKENTLVLIDRIIHNMNQNDVQMETSKFTIENNIKTLNEIEEERSRIILEKNMNAENHSEVEIIENQEEIMNSIEELISEKNEDTAEIIENDEEVVNPIEPLEFEKDLENNETSDITGKIWFDKNNDSSLNDDEVGISGVDIYLYTTDNKMVRATVSDLYGNYRFSNVEEGDYVVGYHYNNEDYQLTTYRKAGIEEENSSKAITVTSELVNAMTNKFNSSNKIENLNVGLQDKDTFDLSVNSYLTHAKVITPKETKEYDFDYLDFAKIEILPKYYDNAIVELEYTIVVQNIGNISGYAEKIGDYIAEGLEFDENLNSIWTVENEGYIYTTELNNTLLNPGDKQELKVFLTKKAGDNSNVIVQNRAILLDSFNHSNIKEDLNGSTGVQSTFITISTGKTKYVVPIILIFITTFVIYMKQKQMIEIPNFVLRINKKFYKEKQKDKVKLKKIYK